MNFLKLVQRRESCRKYAQKPLEREKIMTCIEAARLAPSACNSQPWRFIVVDEPHLMEKLAEYVRIGNMNKFAAEAAAFVVVLSDKVNLTSSVAGTLKGLDFTSNDIGIASAHLCLAAAEQGIGSCIMGCFNEAAIKKLLSIPRSTRVRLVVSLGYPATEEVRPKKRKTMEQVVTCNKF